MSHCNDYTVGINTQIWANVNIMRGAVIGDYCSIGANSEIGKDSYIGNHTRIGWGVFLPSNSRIGSRVFIGPGTIFTDDRFPVVENHDYKAEPPIVEDDASIGAGCVILPGITIHRGARIGAGSVVTKDVPSNSLVYGPQAILQKHDLARS